MYIFITRYEVRDKYIKNYGRAFPVAIIRVSKMVKADKDTFKHVYRDNGTYYYHRILQNQLQKKLKIYFKSCGFTGSSVGTSKTPDMSFLGLYWREIIPAIEEKRADIF